MTNPIGSSRVVPFVFPTKEPRTMPAVAVEDSPAARAWAASRASNPGLLPPPTEKAYLTAEGRFTTDPNGNPPSTDAEIVEALETAASNFRQGYNPFLFPGLSSSEARRLREVTHQELGRFVGRPTANSDSVEKGRGAVWALVLGLVQAAASDEERKPYLASFEQLCATESQPLLRESMVDHLADAAKFAKTDFAAPFVKKYIPEVLPYDVWFGAGARSLNIDFVVMEEGDSVENNQKRQAWMQEVASEFERAHDFEVQRSSPSGSNNSPESAPSATAKKRIGSSEFEMQMRADWSYSAFRRIREVDVMVIHGHAGYGSSLTSAIGNAPKLDDGGKGKVIVLGSCNSRTVLNDLRAKYPNAQVVVTYGLSFANNERSEVGGMVNALVEGVARKKNWAQLHKDLNVAASLMTRSKGRDQVITPFSRAVLNAQLDIDHDGLPNDEDVNFRENPGQSINSYFSFEPNAPAQPSRLGGDTVFKSVVTSANTISEDNEALREANPNGKLVSKGWFYDENDRQNLVLMKTVANDKGERSFTAQFNANYSHMSEAAWNMATVFELHRHAQKERLLHNSPSMLGALFRASGQPLNAVDWKLFGLLSAAFAARIGGITYTTAWDGFLKHYGFPPELDYLLVSGFIPKPITVHPFITADLVSKLRSKLPPEVIQRLESPEVGEPRAP